MWDVLFWAVLVFTVVAPELRRWRVALAEIRACRGELPTARTHRAERVQRASLGHVRQRIPVLGSAPLDDEGTN